MGKVQIVLIEDNPADVFLVRLALKENGIDCDLTTFENGWAATQVLCQQDGPPADPLVPDVILLDLNTPGADGFDVLVRLREDPRLANVKIAILTSSQAETDEIRAHLLGATRFIQKPSHLNDFLSTVGQAVVAMVTVPEPLAAS